jgi:hypothetical protein
MNTYNIGAAAAGIVKFFTRGNAYRKSAAVRAVKSLGFTVFGTVKALLCVIAVIGVILSIVLILVMPLSGGISIPFWLIVWWAWNEDRAAMQAQIDALHRH